MAVVVKLDRVIPDALAAAIHKAPLCPEKVDFAWRRAVGPAVARVTVVRLDEAGVLQVSAADAHWGHELSRSRALILARLARLLGAGTVRSLRVQAGGDGSSKGRSRGPRG